VTKSVYLITGAVVLLISIFAAAARAQDVTVTADVDPNPVGLDQQLSLTITINSPAGTAETPQLPKIEGLTLVAGPSISRNFQWINGKSSSSQSYTYLLEPQKEGEFIIPAISVQVGGRAYQGREIRVKVVKDAGQSQPNVPRRRSPFSIFDDMGLDDSSPLRAQMPRRSDVFAQTEVDKKTVFVGEQVTLTYKVLTQIPLLQVEMRDNPPLSGFWSEEIELPKNPEAKVQVIQGKQYAEYVVKQQALFPTKSGSAVIPPSTFSLLVRTTGRGFFVFSNQQTVVRKTDPLPVLVVPLPDSGRPGNFNGAVGDFKLDALLDKSKVATGEALNLKVRLSGKGNFRTITDFPLSELPGFKIYSSKSRDEISVKDNYLQGSKTWEYVIVPQAPGNERIPEMEFTYFSPSLKRYQQIRSAGLEVAVVQGRGNGEPFSSSQQNAQQSLVKRGTDINYLKLPEGALKNRTGRFIHSFWFYSIVLVPLLFNVALLAYARQQARWEQDLSGLRSRRARKRAEKSLAEAEKCLRHNELVRFHGVLLSSLSGYLNDKFRLAQIEITNQQIRRFMEEISMDPGLANELTDLMDACNFARFAPVEPNRATLEQLLNKAREVIIRLEKATL
jgi:hypothetical protein